MKPTKGTIQFLLPTASPGEIELVYRELLGVIGEKERTSVDDDFSWQTDVNAHTRNLLRTKQLQNLNKLFGKEG